MITFELPRADSLACRTIRTIAEDFMTRSTEDRAATLGTPAEGPTALTRLAEDEALFRDSVLEFADREIRPLVREMDEHAKIPRTLIDKLFALGVMGIEIPEHFGGSGASFFHSVLAVEALAQVDPSISVLVDVQNTLVINAVTRWGNDDVKRRYLPKLAAGTVGAYCLSEAGSGSDAFALQMRATERQTDSRCPAARCGLPTATRLISSSSSPT
jgi:alkylation response protein AidB-like acyl-CoA dehydrogenase